MPDVQAAMMPTWRGSRGDCAPPSYGKLQGNGISGRTESIFSISCRETITLHAEDVRHGSMETVALFRRSVDVDASEKKTYLVS